MNGERDGQGENNKVCTGKCDSLYSPYARNNVTWLAVSEYETSSPCYKVRDVGEVVVLCRPLQKRAAFRSF